MALGPPAAAQDAEVTDEPLAVDADAPCAACGRALGERAWSVAGRPGYYCDDCHETSLPCSACGAPVRSLRISDGRAFCPACAATLVHDPAEIEALYVSLCADATSRLGLALDAWPPLVLDSERALRDRPGTAAPEGLSGVYLREGGRAAIHVLVPLPRARLTAVLAHEIGHAWQGARCPEAQGPRLREGFAEWVSWRLLEGREGGEGEREVIERRSDAYGQGFRIFAGLEARDGTAAALWYARAATSNAPEGLTPHP